MVGTLANASLAWHRVSNGVERHCFMKPLSWDKQLGLVSPLEYAAIQGGKTKGPSRRDTGLDASHHIQGLPRGEAENFFLDILSHRISSGIGRESENGARSAQPSPASKIELCFLVYFSLAILTSPRMA